LEEDELKVLLTNVLYMKIINAKEPHKEIYPKIAKINKF